MCPLRLRSVTVSAMTYGYGDESPRGRSAHRSDESDENYQAAPGTYGDRRYPPQAYEPADPAAARNSAYPQSGYPQTGTQPSDYGHTPAPDYGQSPQVPRQYPAGQYAPDGQYTSGGQYASDGQYTSGGQYASGGQYPSGGQYGSGPAQPADDPYPPQPASGPYPPQPAGPYPPQPAYGRPMSSPGTYGGRTGTFPAAQQPGYEQGYPQQPYQPQTYQPQGQRPGSYRPTSHPGAGGYADPGYPPQRGYPGQQGGDTGYSARQYADPYADENLNDDDPGPKKSKRGLIITLVVIVLLAAGGFGAKVLFFGGDDTSTISGQVNKPTADQAKRVESQSTDAAPLTAAEVFGAATIPSSAGGGTYKVVKSQLASDCKSVVGGDIGTALTTAGCTQAVRATMTSPDGNYVITAGIFNLADATKATAAQSAVRSAIDARKGRFSGFAAGDGTDVVAQAAANIAWDSRGHYLIYCVIVRSDGTAISADDKRTPVIVSDVVESYLGGTVIHKRELASGAPQPSGS